MTKEQLKAIREEGSLLRFMECEPGSQRPAVSFTYRATYRGQIEIKGHRDTYAKPKEDGLGKWKNAKTNIKGNW